MKSFAARCIGATALAILAGCGPEPPEPKVHGTVTYAGEPLAQGLLTFDPVERFGAPAQAVITNGQFATPVLPGKYRVQVINLAKAARSPANMNRVQAQHAFAERKEKFKKYFGDRKKLEDKVAEMQEADGDIPDAAPGNNQLHDITQPDQTLNIVVERYVKKSAAGPP